jgi:hypothetical protein
MYRCTYLRPERRCSGDCPLRYASGMLRERGRRCRCWRRPTAGSRLPPEAKRMGVVGPGVAHTVDIGDAAVRPASGARRDYPRRRSACTERSEAYRRAKSKHVMEILARIIFGQTCTRKPFVSLHEGINKPDPPLFSISTHA